MNAMPKLNTHFRIVRVTFSLVGFISAGQRIWQLQNLAFSDAHLANILFFTWQSKGICKNLYLKPSSCFPFQLEQNLKFYVWFIKLCVIPAYFFNFIICRLPCHPLCFSHRGQFPKPVLFREPLHHLFPLPRRLLLWISAWFTQCPGASLNVVSYERLFLTSKCEAVSCFLYHFILIGVLPTTW